MKPLALSAVAPWCEARLVGEDATVTSVGTDTRRLAAGGLYVALRGERFDGHDFCAEAAANGAAALLVQRPVEVALPQLLCGDTLAALGDLAAGLQAERATRVVAITGSNGKTSVKTLVHGILAGVTAAYANPGNRNNEVGLPLAVIDAPEDAAWAVYEMGAGQPSDIAYLTSIARPDVALVNNIGPAHLERMGSLLGIAQTKGAIYEALAPDGIAVINADDAFAGYFESRAEGRSLLRFGLEASADFTASAIRLGAEDSRFTLHAPGGSVAVHLPLAGRHSVMNALAAAALAVAAGVPLDAIAEGLGRAERVGGRQVPHVLHSGAVLVDDSYNANPGSVAAAIDALAAAGGEAWLVLGDMAELGPGAAVLHAEVGDRARRAGIARLLSLGQASRQASRAFGDGGRHFERAEDLVDALRRELRAGVRCLVKGSRSSAMDRVVAQVLAHDAPGEGDHAA